MGTLIRSAYIGVAVGVFAGCSANPSLSDYLTTTEQGIKTLPHVAEMRQFFPAAPKIHFIEQLGLQVGADPKRFPHWNTVIWIGGRYELTYQTSVDPDYHSHSIKHSGAAAFVLCEVTNITHGGRGAQFDQAGGHSFSEAEWNKIVAANGDFRVIGVHLKTNDPVSGIEGYISAWRQNTWAIQEK